jgi:hypothetical protein
MANWIFNPFGAIELSHAACQGFERLVGLLQILRVWESATAARLTEINNNFELSLNENELRHSFSLRHRRDGQRPRGLAGSGNAASAGGVHRHTNAAGRQMARA